MPEEKEKIYNTIPLINLPINKNQIFSYKSKKSLLPGDLVEVSFFRQTIKAAILEKISRKTTYQIKLKKINTVVERNFFTTNQLKLAQEISKTYQSSLGACLRLFYPKISKGLKNKKSSPTKDFVTPKKFLTPSQKKAFDEIISSREKELLFFGSTGSGKTRVLTAITQKLKSKHQVLILVPEIFLIKNQLNRFKELIPENQILTIHSKMKPSEIYQAHQDIKTGKIKIIIATKLGIFLPFKKLGLIAIEEEHDAFYKQWNRQPRYHIKKLTKLAGKIYNAKIILISATPSIEAFYEHNNKPSLIELPDFLSPATPTICDLKEVKNKNKQAVFSEKLLSLLEKNKNAKKISLVFVPKRGKSQFVICQDCKSSMKCPDCEKPLIHLNEKYSCNHCSFSQSDFSKCPSCGSFRMKDVGFGTQKVAGQIKTIFPGSKIQIIDSDNLNKSDKETEKLLSKIQSGNLDFLIGTYSVARGIYSDKIGLSCVLNIDNWSFQSDFKFDEKWLGNLFQLAGRAKGGQGCKSFVIQTFHPENELLKFVEKEDWKSFLKEELVNRKTLKYPPFYQIIKITISDKNSKKLDLKIKKLHNKLIEESFNSSLIVSPYSGFNKKRLGRWEKHLLVKINKSSINYKLDFKKIHNFIIKNQKDLKVDFDPENIF